MKKITALLVFAVTLIALSMPAFAWGPKIDERPDALKAGQTRGVFIWRDQSGFHLWTTTRGQRHVFSGTITTDGQRFDLKTQKLESNHNRGVVHPFGLKTPNGKDRVQIDNDRDTIRFRFENVGRDTDGINFRVVGGNRVKFDLYMDGRRIDPNEIYIGEDGWHPGRSTFTLYR